MLHSCANFDPDTMNSAKVIVTKVGLLLLVLLRLRWRLPPNAVVLDIQQRVHMRTYQNLLTYLTAQPHPVYIQLGLTRRHISKAMRFPRWYPRVRFCIVRPRLVASHVLLTDSQHVTTAARSIRLRFIDTPNATQPFPMHPQLYAQYHEEPNLPKYRAQQRTARILFAGNPGDTYNSPVPGMLNRGDIVRHARNHPAVTIAPPVDQSQWLSLLGTASFFLAPPGVVKPLSHNITEALAVGTIPITNYPEWLTPPLVDGETCLAFTTLDELERQLERAANMPPDELARMRANAARYYDMNVATRAVAPRLLAEDEIRINDSR